MLQKQCVIAWGLSAFNFNISTCLRKSACQRLHSWAQSEHGSFVTSGNMVCTTLAVGVLFQRWRSQIVCPRKHCPCVCFLSMVHFFLPAGMPLKLLQCLFPHLNSPSECLLKDSDPHVQLDSTESTLQNSSTYQSNMDYTFFFHQKITFFLFLSFFFFWYYAFIYVGFHYFQDDLISDR